jgi:hypothetical protein
MPIRSLTIGILATLVLGCAQTPIDKTASTSLPLSADTPWQARGKMLLAHHSRQQTLRFKWTYSPSQEDRIELSDPLGLNTVTLIENAGRFYQEGAGGTRTRLSEVVSDNMLGDLLSYAPNDIALLLTGAPPVDTGVTTEVLRWSTTLHFATPEVLRVNFGGYDLKIIVSKWDIGRGE